MAEPLVNLSFESGGNNPRLDKLLDDCALEAANEV